jgi:predicted amidophosphoribosyltransferase
MCGCMLLHATMNHPEQKTVIQTARGADAATGAGARYCKQCGFPVNQDFSFCPGCGAGLQAAMCPACRQKVDPSWGSCANCGYPLGETQGKFPPRR